MSQSKEFYQFYSVLFSVRQIYLIIDNMGFASQGGSHCTTVWGKNETKINLHSVVFNVVVVRCHEHHVYLEATSFFYRFLDKIGIGRVYCHPKYINIQTKIFSFLH